MKSCYLADVHSLSWRIRVARKVSMIWGLVTFVFNGETHSPDRPLAFMPNVTMVVLIKMERLRYAHGKNKTRTVMLIRTYH